MYITKQKVPYARLSNIINLFLLIPLSNSIASQSLEGPTSDFEDNVQLHSSATAECDLFLTSDKMILEMRFFGKAQILPEMK